MDNQAIEDNRDREDQRLEFKQIFLSLDQIKF